MNLFSFLFLNTFPVMFQNILSGCKELFWNSHNKPLLSTPLMLHSPRVDVAQWFLLPCYLNIRFYYGFGVWCLSVSPTFGEIPILRDFYRNNFFDKILFYFCCEFQWISNKNLKYINVFRKVKEGLFLPPSCQEILNNLMAVAFQHITICHFVLVNLSSSWLVD